MSNRKLVILGVVAAVMIVWAVVQSRISNRPRPEAEGPVYLIQGLNPADIDRVVLHVGEKTVTLKRENSGFVVPEKDGYPAAGRKVNDLITKCLDIKTVELYTDDKASHKDLGVTEEDAQSMVKFFKRDSSVLTGVVVGKSKAEGEGAYVRLVSSDKVYITLEHPWFTDRAMSYINPVITLLNEDDVESVTVSGPNDVFTLRTEKDSDNIVLENLPAGKKLKDEECKKVFGALTNLRFNDVKKESTIKEGLNFERQFVCRLKDSTVYTLNIARKDDKTYVTCNAEFTDKTPVTKENAVESAEQLKEKELKLLARDKAGEFSAKHKDWVYEIPEYKVEQLVKELSELLEDEQAGDPNSAEGQQ